MYTKGVCRSLIISSALLLFMSGSAAAEARAVGVERADGARLASAVGHFARSRSLLIAALQEFDKGNAMVDPSAMLDAKEWRHSLIDRANDLERVLDPQPRATRSGVKFSPDSRLIGSFTEATSD